MRDSKNISFIKYIHAFFIATLFISCAEIDNQSSTSDNLKGNYHFLSDKGIKVFLPEDFKKYNLVEYQNVLKKHTDKNVYDYEIERLNMLKKMEGSFYIFFDKNSGSTFTINTIEHFKFSRKDANQLLGFVKLTNDQIEAKKSINLTKLTAKYTGNSSQKIFKSVHKIENLKSKKEGYNTAYIISSNDKTVIMQLLTPTEIEFDTYIQKLKM